MGKYDKLLGQTVVATVLASDRQTLQLYTLSGHMFLLQTVGDCCSSTWIEAIDGEDALYGTIKAVEDIEMPDLGDVPTGHHESVDCVQYYGLRITTNKGRAVIDYRNDSNGYYGGSIEVYQK